MPSGSLSATHRGVVKACPGTAFQARRRQQAELKAAELVSEQKRRAEQKAAALIAEQKGLLPAAQVDALLALHRAHLLGVELLRLSALLHSMCRGMDIRRPPRRTHTSCHNRQPELSCLIRQPQRILANPVLITFGKTLLTGLDVASIAWGNADRI